MSGKPGKLKALAAGCGCLLFLIASAWVALRAHHYQTTGEPMPNWKGGFMTPRDGYYIAVASAAVAIGWLLLARRFLCASSTHDSGSEGQKNH
jgi:hypothetical protein